MPDPSHFSSIGWILVAIAALCATANQIDDFFKRRAGKDGDRNVGPQPFEVKAAAEYVHKAEFERALEQNVTEHQNLFSKLGGMERGLRSEIKTDTTQLHDKINKVDKEVGSIAAGMGAQNQQLASINATVTRILERGPRS